MRRLEVGFQPLSKAALTGMKKRAALAEDFDLVVTPGTEVYDGDTLVAGFYELAEDSHALLQMIKDARAFVKDYRTSGLRANAFTFGYRPREPMRKDFCSPTSLLHREPDLFHELARWAPIVASYYERAAPSVYTNHKMKVDDVRPEWRLNNSLFTSGIVNKNTSHFYHRDGGNFSETWNSMIVLCSDIEGGETVIPEYRAAFDPKGSPCVLVFNAVERWHAVRKILLKSQTFSYRYSLVYYSLNQMCACQSFAEEVQRIKKIGTQRGKNRADLLGQAERLAGGNSRSSQTVSALLETGTLQAKAQSIGKRSLEERYEAVKAEYQRTKSSRAAAVLKQLERRLKDQGK